MNGVGVLPRVWRSAGRVGLSFKAAPRVTLALIGWRLSLPVLKRLVPLPQLARLMWCPHDPCETRGVSHGILKNSGRVLLSTNCLERSLVFYRMLSRAGAAPVLVLGVRKDSRAVAGHAWVEVDGELFGEAAAADYERIVEFGAHGRAISDTAK